MPLFGLIFWSESSKNLIAGSRNSSQLTHYERRKQKDPLPLLMFPFNSIPEVTARFVKFSVMAWYQWGGGLQYFSVKRGGAVLLDFSSADMLELETL